MKFTLRRRQLARFAHHRTSGRPLESSAVGVDAPDAVPGRPGSPESARRSTALRIPGLNSRWMAGAAPLPPRRRAITIYVDPAAHQQLRMLGIELEQSPQALVAEGINAVFEGHGKSSKRKCRTISKRATATWLPTGARTSAITTRASFAP